MIKNMRILEVRDDGILAEALIKTKDDSLELKPIEQIIVSRAELEGVYLGNGKNYRSYLSIMTVGAIGIGFICLFLL